MKHLIGIILLISLTNICFGQKAFTVNNGSKNYSASISVEKCNQENCEGKATIKIFNKNNKALFQTLYSENLYFFLDSTQNPTVNIIELYNEQSPLIFEDFNFDGTEDVAVRNGNKSNYDGPSYDVYVFNMTKQQFVLSKELTKLANENLGMFQINKERKRIITFGKDGCCWHITTEYEVVPKKGLVKVYELIEDANSGKTVTVTTKEFVNNNWTKKVKKYKIEEYYKEN